jgi:hypothetical protein
MNKIKILMFIAFSNICLAQNINLNQGNISSENYYTEIKFEYVNGKIIIPVKINNNTYRFLLDTGAPNCITKKLNNIVKPTIIQETKISDANNNKSSMDVVELPDLIIGEIVFKNSLALSYNLEENLVFDCYNIDGFIGSNLLRNSIIQINIKNQTLIITNDEKKLEFNKKNDLKLSLIGNQSSPYIWIKLKGENSGKEQVLLDTGMKGFYDLSSRNYNLLKNENIFKIIATGNGSQGIGLFGNSAIKEQLKILLPEMKVSNSNFLNISSITTNDNNSRIGIDLFENGIGTIDYKNKRFYFDEYETNKDLSEKSLGFSPTILNGKLSIGIVWDDKLKEKIYVGDKIIEINGKNYENYPICDLISKESIFKSNEIKKITIKTKSGELKTVNL